MTDTDIHVALERATEHLSPPPDLLERVRAGGRRRVVRRRAVLFGGLGAAVAAAGSPLALGRGRGGEVADPVTRGDLAGDRQFLQEARAAWSRGADAFETRSRPHVLWAGTTPAGPAALISQRATVETAPQDLLGWVEPVAGGGLRGTGSVRLMPPGKVEPGAILIGERRDVLVVADLGQPVDLSADYSFDEDGKVRRTYSRVSSGADWVFVRRVAPQAENVRIAMIRAGLGEGIPLDNFGDVVHEKTNQVPELLDRRLPGATGPWEMPGGYDDLFGYHAQTGLGAWQISGATPDGRQFTVRTLPLEDTVRAFWFLGGPEPHYAGLMRDGVVRVRLPGQQGVVVAVLNATLRYRTRGAWIPVSDVALLPDAATELEVRPRGGGDPRTVPLP
ncbi:hypothetical protein ACQP2F_28985 [Actinoplanes sp. CA-030573]|uniref:hypothetical protein n=1 Tax=Actinoplanes sp. CA-030573 TaxID=3239898 RepID=UPI003D91A79B